MSYREALALTIELANDPTSHVGAAVRGWMFPASREFLAAKVNADNYVAIRTSKRPTLERMLAPWDKPTRRYGTASMSMDELRAVLDRHRARVDAEGEG